MAKTSPTPQAKTTTLIATSSTQIDTVLVARALGQSGRVTVDGPAGDIRYQAAIALDIDPLLLKLNTSNVTLNHTDQIPTAQEAWNYLDAHMPAGWKLEPYDSVNNLVIHRVTHDGWYPYGGLFAYGFRIYDTNGVLLKRLPKIGNLALQVEFMVVLQDHL